MPETDPRTPDPLKRAPTGGANTGGANTGGTHTPGTNIAGAHTADDHTGRDYSAAATDGDAAAPSEAPPAAPPAGPYSGPSAEPADSAQPVLRADSRAAGSRGAHSKAGPSKPAKESQAHGPLYLWIKEVATVVAIAVVLSFLIKTFLFRAFYIPSESMVSTLDVNDRIFVNLLVPEPFALERGDVVVFKDTKGWLVPTPDKADGPFTWVQDGLTFVGLLPDNSEQHLVKRVIGLPGDHVVCCDAGGKLTINGKEVDETYVNPAEVPDIRNFDVVVPDGKIWVMGDNRNHSADSRAHQDSSGGFIDMPDIEGKAAVIAWPLNRLTGLGNYPDVFQNVPTPTGK